MWMWSLLQALQHQYIGIASIPLQQVLWVHGAEAGVRLERAFVASAKVNARGKQLTAEGTVTFIRLG